jgi:hypothetical protein
MQLIACKPAPAKAGSRESVPAAASKPRCNWRELFLSVSSPPRYAGIAITPATVRPARSAAIVEWGKDRLIGFRAGIPFPLTFALRSAMEKLDVSRINAVGSTATRLRWREDDKWGLIPQ